MQAINSKYILVKKMKEEKKDGFQTVEVQDSFINKGEVFRLPDQPVFVDNQQLKVGDLVIFAKYSPDTHEVSLMNGATEEKMKMVKIEDVLTII